MKAPGRVVAKSVLAEVWETSSTTGAALEVATMVVVKVSGAHSEAGTSYSTFLNRCRWEA